VTTTKTKNGKVKPLKAKDQAKVKVIGPQGVVRHNTSSVNNSARPSNDNNHHKHNNNNNNNNNNNSSDNASIRAHKSPLGGAAPMKAALCPFCQAKNQYAAGVALVCCYQCKQTFAAPP
jgi:hypothetical protein